MKPLIASRRLGIAALVLIIGVLLIYGQVWRFEFTNFDDDGYVTQNPVIQRGLTTEGILWAFSNGLMGNWHPLTCLSHMLDCSVFGPFAGGHHSTSVLIHAVNASLVFLVLWRITGCFWRSFIVAALFGWHPLRVESVAWISERKDVLSGLFALLSLLAYVKYIEESNSRRDKTIVWYGASLGLFALGLMSKPMLVTWPFVLLLLDYWPLMRLQEHQLQPAVQREPNTPATTRFATSSWRQLVTEKLPFILISILFCVVTFLVQRNWGALGQVDRLSLVDRVENALVSYVRYLAKTFWPTNLAAIYPHPGSWELWAVAGAVAILISLSAMVIAHRHRQPWLLFGWCWFLGMLVPVLGIIQVGRQAMADRYTYLPHLGVFIGFVWFGERLLRRFPQRRWLATLLAGAVLVGCLATSWRQTGYWRNSVTLFERALAVTDNNVAAEYNYAQGLSMVGRTPEAIKHYRQALEVQPDYFPAHVNLGVMLLREGDYHAATNHLGQAVSLQPTNSLPRFYLGLALSSLKDWEAADAQFSTASVLGSKEPSLPAEWAKALLALGKVAEAVQQLRVALDYEPDSVEKLNNLAWILATSPQQAARNGQEAIRHAAKACLLTEYRDVKPMGTLAAAYAEAGQFQEACRTAELAIQLGEEQGEDALVERNRQLLRMYQAGKPFRETP